MFKMKEKFKKIRNIKVKIIHASYGGVERISRYKKEEKIH